jgi:hypothetical protein
MTGKSLSTHDQANMVVIYNAILTEYNKLFSAPMRQPWDGSEVQRDLAIWKDQQWLRNHFPTDGCVALLNEMCKHPLFDTTFGLEEVLQRRYKIGSDVVQWARTIVAKK